MRWWLLTLMRESTRTGVGCEFNPALVRAPLFPSASAWAPTERTLFTVDAFLVVGNPNFQDLSGTGVELRMSVPARLRLAQTPYHRGPGP